MTTSRNAVLRFVEVIDLGVVGLAFAVAVGLTVGSGAGALDDWLGVLQMRITVGNALFVCAYMLVWHLILRSCGLYRSYRLSSPLQELRDLGMTVLIAVTPLVPLAVLYSFDYVTPGFLVLFGILAFAGLALERRVLRAIGRRVRRRGRNLRNVVIVGTGSTALELSAKLAARDDFGYRVVDVVNVVHGLNGGNGNGNGAAGGATLRRVEEVLDAQQIDEVFVALPLDTFQPLISKLISVCELQGITVRLMAQIANLFLARAAVDSIEGEPVLTIYTGPAETFHLQVKRLIDVLGSLAGLLVLAPLFLLVAITVKLDSPGRVFFAQERVGLNRRRFRALKFRTMVDGADALQASLEPYNEAAGPIFKIRNDPRVTRVGKWLRNLSIDELPQLVNVLMGDMSLVGPRPLPVRDVDRIDVRWHKRRFSVKPGITCLWQVESRQPNFEDWVHWDMEYIDNWSLSLDFKILAKTLPAVFSGQGVH